MVTRIAGGSRVILSSREAAIRLGRCTALIECELPVGFHELPEPHKRAILEGAAAEAVEHVVEAMDSQRVAAA